MRCGHEALRTVSKDEPRSAFEFEGARIQPGRRATIEVPVSRLPPGSWTSMPVVVIHGREPGPTVWLSGAIHGDELNGVIIVRRLLSHIRASELRGTILAVPIVNVIGVTMGSRYLPDRRDLNRSFPGSPRGSMTSRLANLFFDQVARRCNFGIDFHSGSAGRDNLPQIRCDLKDQATRLGAEAFAAPFTLHAALRDGSLREAARNCGIPVLLFEGGEAQRIDPAVVETGVSGALRTLQHLNMIPQHVDPPSARVYTAWDTSWMRAGRSGFFMNHVGLGTWVKAGTTIATILDSVGRQELPVRPKVDGVIVGLLRTALVHRGDALFHLAEMAQPTVLPPAEPPGGRGQ